MSPGRALAPLKGLLAVMALGACQIGVEGIDRPPAGSAPVMIGTFPGFQGLMNTARAGPGLNPLSYNAKLAAAAQVHADDMSANNFFSHVGSDGSSFAQRIVAQGYNYAWAAENIAQGQVSEAEVFADWMNSASHRANILSAEPTEFGLAWAPGNYWVLELARPLP